MASPVAGEPAGHGRPEESGESRKQVSNGRYLKIHNRLTRNNDYCKNDGKK